MFKRLLWSALIGVLISFSETTYAQFSIRFDTRHKRLVQYESVDAWVRIDNNTGSSLDLTGADQDVSLSIEVSRTPGVYMFVKHGPLFPAVVISPMNYKKMTLDLLQHYDLRKTGPYTLRAKLNWGDSVFVSGKIYIDIVPGLKIDSLTLIVPGGGRSTRKCELRTLYREKSEHLFLSIADPSLSRNLGVFDLGPLVRLFTPVMLGDIDGHIHVLNQSGPWRYTHTVYTYNGAFVEQQFYRADVSRIGMETMANGMVRIVGGELYDGRQDEMPSYEDMQIFTE